MNIEAILITKVIKEGDIHQVINLGADSAIVAHKDIWDFIYDHYSKYKKVPTSSMIDTEFPEFQPEDEDYSIEYIIEKLNEQHIKDTLEDIIISTATNLEDAPVEALRNAYNRISTLSHGVHIIKDTDLVKDYWVRVENLRERSEKTGGDEILGIPSLIDPIDYLFGGFQKGDFITLMGWTGSAKTWLGIYLAMNAWKMGRVPLYFSLEMDDIQFGYRFDTLAAGGKFSNTSLMNAKHIDINKYKDWMNTEFRDKHPFYLVTNEGMGEATQNTVQAKIDQYKPDIVFLDYHGLFEDAKRGKNQTEKVLNLSKDFKRMAERNSIPIVDVVAVTMEDGHGLRPPELNEVAWSKQLAYDSDLCLSMYKDGHLLTVESKKTRRCEPFAFKLSWDFDSGVVLLHDWK